jgi:hypothetical protein
VVLNRDEGRKIRARFVLGLGALLAFLLLAIPGSASAAYRDNPPNPNGDPLMMTRIVVAQENPLSQWNRCSDAGFGLIDHITTDRRGWFKRNWKRSVLGKTYARYIKQGARKGLCNWIQDSSVRKELPFLIQVWYKAIRDDYIENIRRGLKRARCELKWGVFWTALDTFIPVKGYIPWAVKSAVLNGISAKGYC